MLSTTFRYSSPVTGHMQSKHPLNIVNHRILSHSGPLVSSRMPLDGHMIRHARYPIHTPVSGVKEGDVISLPHGFNVSQVDVTARTVGLQTSKPEVAGGMHARFGKDDPTLGLHL